MTSFVTSKSSTNKKAVEPSPLSFQGQAPKESSENEEAIKPRGNQEAPVKQWSGNASSPVKVKYDVLAHLKRIPALLSVYDALQLSRELRKALIQALTSPDLYVDNVEPVDAQHSLRVCASCMTCITFTDDDLQLGVEYHNRPLYVIGKIGDTQVNRIMLDCGSAVNLLPLKTLHAMGMSAKHLSPSMLTIQGFNQVGQRALGTIEVKIEIDDFHTRAIFHVIDADTTYNVLLGRPWLHVNGVIPSTLHQVFKFYKDGEEKTVVADPNPFGSEEVNYADAKFYKMTNSHFSADNRKDKEAITRNEGSSKPSTSQSSKASKVIRVKTTPKRVQKGQVSIAPKERLVLKYVPKEQGKLKEVLTSVRDTMSSLTISYTCPLRRINQSIPQDIVISTTFGEDESQTKRFVFFKERTSNFPSSSAPYNLGPQKSKVFFKKGKKKVITRQKNDIPKTSPSEAIVFTDKEQAMLTEEEGDKKPRVSVFQRLGGYSKPTFQKSNVNKKWKLKQKIQRRIVLKNVEEVKAEEDLEGIVQVNCASFEENQKEDSLDTKEEDNSILEDDPEFKNNVQPAPPQIEDGGQATVDELREINLGTADDPKPVFVSAQLSLEELNDYEHLLREYRDVFAWGYQDMLGLDPKIAVHRLAVLDDKRPVKQGQRRFRPELTVQIEIEVDKLISAGFIREVRYPTWLANIVPVKKKNGQVRICIDFRDLNDACPKDEFPLPITELLVDATTGFGALSFMDGFSGYNQIKMAPEDEELTAFRTPKGIYCYTVMPFGLKNAGATYQRAMTIIFNDLLHNTVECYVDDLVVKTRKREYHLSDLKRVFDRLRKNQLKMNPLKCAFGVTSGKFLGFVVRHRGIEIDPTKIKSIIEMPAPRKLRELRSLQGKLAYIRRFISNLSGRCQPFSRLMKKDVPFVWDQACQNAFESIKEYLSKPPVLMAPIKGKPLILYIAALERSLGAMLAQNNDEGKENALYYLSRTLVGAEHNYSPIEKMCLALIFSVQKLRHYLLAHPIRLISKADPLKYLMSKPFLSGRVARWSVLLTEFDITYVPQKAIKGQALADFLAAHPIPDNMQLPDDFPDDDVLSIETSSWQLYFDGASRKRGAGAGIVLVTPSGGLIPYSFSLLALCSNNAAEYEALIIGLEIALEMHIDCLQVFGDSQLIVKQLNDQYEVKNENLVFYYQRGKYLMSKFQDIQINHVPRSENDKADALANLAASLTLPEQRDIQVTVGERHLLPPALDRMEATESTNVVTVCEIEEDPDWRQPFIEYFLHGRLPSNPKRKVDLRRRALRFAYLNDTLYRRSIEGILLRCLSKEEAANALYETHAGTCGAHQAGPKLAAQLKRLGYYWPTMVQDSMKFAKTCKVCQLHGDFIHQPPQLLHPTMLSWPFETWGLDVIGPFKPPSSRFHQYTLAGTYYFSKWVKAVPLKEVRALDVVNFIKNHIIYRYGVPSKIIYDNALYFKNQSMWKLIEKYKFRHGRSASYNPSANGQAEAFNKVLCKILKKMVSKNKRDWHDRLPEALWAYRTTIRTSTGCTPYSLVYGSEAVLPLEVQLPSLRVAAQLTNPEENTKIRLAELEALDEKRLDAQQRLEIYQAQVAGAFNKKVKFRSFSVGDLVLTVRRPVVIARRMKGKFEPKWEGPYVITKVFPKGAYELSNSEGKCINSCVNGKFIKKFYA